ncbi:hypothetical protein AHiyo1_41710 [Arthrobacter sp. Hiyo1]|nr:hypothetical protein AHiyo1_41710 [Arthrobacter sp. Hiyo1]
MVPVFGWASWLAKEIVAPGLSSKQTRLRELVKEGRRCAAPAFLRQHRITHKRGRPVSEGILNSCGRVREIAPGAGMGA